MCADRRRWLRAGAYVLSWLVVFVPVSVAIFLTSQRTVTLASHDAEVRPTVDGYVTLRTGPFLPDVRVTSGREIGVDVRLGKTEAASTEQLVQRYAFIASQPEGQIARVEGAVRDMAYDAALAGALIAAAPPLVWVALGRRRRHELLALVPTPRGVVVVAAGCAVLLLAGLVMRAPWSVTERTQAEEGQWYGLQEYLPQVRVPAQAEGIEVLGGATTAGTRRLVLSAIDTYERSLAFYRGAVEDAAGLELRQPAEDETVAVLVADRHDNIGMDAVARAVADRAGATVVLNAGDDTSTGQPWEAFSLDSLHDAFEDYEGRYAVAGNHDHGGFVEERLSELGWTVAQPEPVEGPGGGVLLGWADPRSSGLGSWRDQRGLSISEVSEVIADVACESEERVNTLLVHDANMGDETLRRGCADVVLSGHLHVQVGPEPVVGENGARGYAYTNGTTGGAAYAIAVGSKLRRPAQVTLLTYREGRPVGLQPVLLQTNGVFVVGDYLTLTPAGPPPADDEESEEDEEGETGTPDDAESPAG